MKKKITTITEEYNKDGKLIKKTTVIEEEEDNIYHGEIKLPTAPWKPATTPLNPPLISEKPLTPLAPYRIGDFPPWITITCEDIK